MHSANSDEKTEFVNAVARDNVLHVVRRIVEQSDTIRQLVDEGRIAVVGAMYDVTTGKIDFLIEDAIGLPPAELALADVEAEVMS